MSNEDEWTEPEYGITLGPEEILRREIEKSKNLKVERLQLKDEIEKLQAENTRLTRKNQALKEEISKTRPNTNSDTTTLITEKTFSPFSPRWTFFLLLFNSCALAILLYFFLQE